VLDKEARWAKEEAEAKRRAEGELRKRKEQAQITASEAKASFQRKDLQRAKGECEQALRSFKEHPGAQSLHPKLLQPWASTGVVLAEGGPFRDAS
jgi:hypothetical protein